MEPAAPSYDCQACGACCANLRKNHAEGSAYWVQIQPVDKILQRDDLVRKYVTHDRGRAPHMKLTHDGVCTALTGTIGTKASCRIYHQRPSPCRRVEAGDPACLRSRRDRGLDPADDPPPTGP